MLHGAGIFTYPKHDPFIEVNIPAPWSIWVQSNPKLMMNTVSMMIIPGLIIILVLETQ